MDSRADGEPHCVCSHGIRQLIAVLTSVVVVAEGVAWLVGDAEEGVGGRR